MTNNRWRSVYMQSTSCPRNLTKRWPRSGSDYVCHRDRACRGNKARLVIEGYRQIKDVSFTGTYARVSRLASLRIRIPVWVKIDHMDVTTASLHLEIGQSNVLMNLPELRGLGDLSEFSIHSQASSGTAGVTVR